MAQRSARGSLQPTPVQRDSPSSPLVLAAVAVIGAVLSAIGAWDGVGVLTKGGPTIEAVGVAGTVYLLGGSWFRNRQGPHWFELQQTRAAVWTNLQPGSWQMPALAEDLRSHFPSEMGPALKAWHLSPPDGSTPDAPSGDADELSRVRGRAFDGLSQISKAERPTRSCSRCKWWIWLRCLPLWAADVEHPPPAVLG
ncbi:MAG: hypothetical protein WBF51_06680 [Candidatus Dormiibacterota bacterium]